MPIRSTHARVSRCLGPFVAVVLALGVSGCVAEKSDDAAAAETAATESVLSSVTLKTSLRGLYVGAANNGGGAVNATATAAQAWETFSLADVNGGALASGDLVRIKAGSGQYFQAENGGGGALNAASANAMDWETFRIVSRKGGASAIASGDVIGLQTVTSGAWVSAQDGGGGAVFAYGGAFGSWEELVIGLGTSTTPPTTTPPTTTPPTTTAPTTTPPPPSGATFVHTNGTRIVDGANRDLFLKGINLGNWLVWEGYLMMGDYNFRTHTQFFNSLATALGGSDRAAEFENQWRLNYVDEKAIGELSGLGFNAVRVPFNYNLFWWDGKLRDNGFVYFDKLLAACRLHGVYVLLDMHGAPGYQNPGDHSDNGNSNSSQPRGSVTFWDGNNVSIASQVWRHVAERYKDEPMIWGYDLLNEPVPQPGREYELLSSMVTMRNAIREVDSHHVIVAEGNWWGSDLSKLDWQDGTVRTRTGVSSQWDSNLVYEIHHYGAVADTMGREGLTNRLNVPLILGEYGETDDANLRATTNWARQALAGAFPWTFKKMSYDKALWTIPTNGDYETVKAFIRNGGTPPTQLYNAMISFAQTNVRNGHPSITWNQSFYDGVK